MSRDERTGARRRAARRRVPRIGTLLETVTENLLEALMITDTEGRILYVNPAFERTTGYRVKEVIGSTPSILKSGQHEPDFYARVWRPLQNGKSWRGELLNRKKSGELYHAELRLVPVVSAGGKVTHYIASHRDISEEVERRRVDRELEDLRTDMVGMVTHDLRNPVANVIGYLDLLLEKPEAMTDRQIHVVKRARDNAHFMLELIADILDTTRIDAGKLKLVAAPHDMRDVVREALERSAFIGRDKDIRLVPDLPDRSVPVVLDRGKVVQVLNNLVSNAIKFSPPGSTVRAGTRTSGRVVETWVADEGQGIPESEVPLLFGKFWRGSSKATRGEKSTGLGLYIVNQMLRLHQGTIRVDTAPGKGATFTFKLPAGQRSEVTAFEAR